MHYPPKFTREARDRVEVERVKARRAFTEQKQNKRRHIEIEQLLHNYMLSVFLAFAKEASAIEQWGVDEIRSECEEFLRLLAIDIQYVEGPRDFRLIGSSASSIDMSVMDLFRRSAQWAEFETLLLKAAEARISQDSLRKPTKSSSDEAATGLPFDQGKNFRDAIRGQKAEIAEIERSLVIASERAISNQSTHNLQERKQHLQQQVAELTQSLSLLQYGAEIRRNWSDTELALVYGKAWGFVKELRDLEREIRTQGLTLERNRKKQELVQVIQHHPDAAARLGLQQSVDWQEWGRQQKEADLFLAHLRAKKNAELASVLDGLDAAGYSVTPKQGGKGGKRPINAGRPRKDTERQIVQGLRNAGKSWKQITIARNAATGNKLTPDAYRRLLNRGKSQGQ